MGAILIYYYVFVSELIFVLLLIVVIPSISRVVVGVVLLIPNLLFVLSQCNSDGYIEGSVPCPTTNLLEVKLLTPVPPYTGSKIPALVLSIFV